MFFPLRKTPIRILCALILKLFIASTAWAEDVERADPPEMPAGEPAAVEMAEQAEPAPMALGAGWVMLMGRFGGGAGGGGGTFMFDDVPEGEDDETSFTSRSAYSYITAFDALFFPTKGRGFMLSASTESQVGRMTMNFDEEEYGSLIGLDVRMMDYQIGYLLGGLGYRWLYGDRKQHGSILHGKAGIGGGNMTVDGFASSTGGAVVFEVGANYFHRFDDALLLGVQLDFRVWGAAFQAFEVQSLDTEAGLGVGGAASFMSLIVGWELF